MALDSAKELLPCFEEYWQGYTLTYEPLHWYVSDRGNALASGSTSIKNTIRRKLSVGGHHQQLLPDKAPLGYR